MIFFDTTGPTRTIWYYERPRPKSRKKYSKTAPLLYEEFARCLDWWKNRAENVHAWKADPTGLIQRDSDGRVTTCNLDSFRESIDSDRTKKLTGAIDMGVPQGFPFLDEQFLDQR